jgi:hypothetical protein
VSQQRPSLPRLFAEGAAVVVSILLAFGIDAWWDGRQQLIEEAQLLVGLHSETSANLSVLRAGLDSLDAKQARLRRFVLSTPTDYSRELGDSAWSSVVRPQYRDFSVTLSYGFLDATISAGKLELIRDTDLRAVLAGLRGLQGTADEPLGPLVDLSTEAAVILSEYPEIQWGLATQSFAFEGNPSRVLQSLRADERLVRLATAQAMLTIGYIAGLRSVEDEFIRVTSMIEAAQVESR